MRHAYHTRGNLQFESEVGRLWMEDEEDEGLIAENRFPTAPDRL
jgi:hypothetical protein